MQHQSTDAFTKVRQLPVAPLTKPNPTFNTSSNPEPESVHTGMRWQSVHLTKTSLKEVDRIADHFWETFLRCITWAYQPAALQSPHIYRPEKRGGNADDTVAETGCCCWDGQPISENMYSTHRAVGIVLIFAFRLISCARTAAGGALTRGSPTVRGDSHSYTPSV